jgi:hypothetical protein
VYKGSFFFFSKMAKEHIENMNIKEHEKTFSIYEG